MTTVHRNAAAGETLAVQSSGRVLRAELRIEAAHHAPPAHVHPRSAERFTVVDGAIRVRIGRRWSVLEAGGSVLVPAGVTHAYAGVPGTAAVVRVEIDPPGRMAEFFTDVYGDERRVPSTGNLTLRAGADLLRRYPDDVVLPGLPRVLARPVLHVLARAAPRGPGR